MAYNNIPSNRPASSSDVSQSILTGLNSNPPVQINNQALIALTGILENKGFANPSAETAAIAILTQATTDGYNAFAVIDTVKATANNVISGIVAEILNSARFKTSFLGYVKSTNPVPDVIRNILP